MRAEHAEQAMEELVAAAVHEYRGLAGELKEMSC